MKKQVNKPDPESSKEEEDVNKKYPGYPVYPEEEDIYNQFKKEKDVDPEDVTKKKDPVERGTFGKNNEKGLEDDLIGADLDIPGAELDDDLEDLGEEDEENNYYSLGGDNHEDLEEDRAADDRK